MKILKKPVLKCFGLSAAIVLLMFMLFASFTGCRKATTESTAQTQETILDTTEEGGIEDDLLLSNNELPEIANVDYSKFPKDLLTSLPGGTTYYVAKDGNDGNDGKSLSTPLQTIEYGLELARDGDTILIREGVYNSEGIEVTQSNFVLSNYESENVLLRASSGAKYGISIKGAVHDTTINGINVDGFKDTDIYIGDPSTQRNLVIKNLTASNSDGGITFYFGDGDLVDGLLVKHVFLKDIRGIGFNCGVGSCNNVRIVGMHVKMKASVNDTAADAVAFEQGDNVLIENSIVEHAGGDGIDSKASRVAVMNSIVRHIARNGVKFWHGGDLINSIVYDTGADAQVVFDGTGDYRILNSVMVYHLLQGGESYIISVGYGQNDPIDLTMANSVVYHSPGSIYFSPTTNLQVKNNIFFAFRGQSNVEIEAGENYYNDDNFYTKFDNSNRLVDPLFIDAAGGNFHLDSKSPAYNGGTTMFGVPDFDILNKKRTGAITIGPYQ